MDRDALYAAAIAGDAAAISKLGREADKLIEYDRTILHTESQYGTAERVRFLLREFPSKNLLVKLDVFQQSVIHIGGYCGQTEVVEVLIDAARQTFQANYDDPQNPVISPSFQAFLRQTNNDQDTALSHTVMQGYTAIVKMLVEADPSDRHIQNSKGKTPMYIAAEMGRNDIIKVICTTCTAPSLDGPHGTTALHAAISNLHKVVKEADRDVIRMIIDAAKRASSTEDPPHMSFENLFNRTDESESTVLELAVKKNYANVVELILQEDPVFQEGRGGKKNELVGLIQDADYEDNEDIVKLLSKAYEVGINSEHKGVIALIRSIQRREKENILCQLEENKNLVSFVDEEGWTPLHYAAHYEFDSILEVIIAAQKDVGFQFMYEDRTFTPLHVASENGYTSTIIRLMKSWPLSSSAYTSTNENGQNILHFAAMASKKEMIYEILKHCPEMYKNKIINQPNDDGDTPLHLLVSNGCFIPEFIKHKGLDIAAKNKENETPRDMLYSEDDIVADQVQIKIALDDVQINPEKDILESSVLPSKRKIKDVIFNQQAKLMMHEKLARMKEDLQKYKNNRAAVNWFDDAIGGNVNARAALETQVDTLGKEGETMLHVESIKGDPNRVRFIVREFPNKNLLVKLDMKKRTALHLAADHGYTHVVEVLIEAARDLPSTINNPVSSFQAFIRQPGPMMNTALHIAVITGNLAIVKLLVEADPSDTHNQNEEGKTPIYIAAENGYKDIVKIICTTCTPQSLVGPNRKTTALHAFIKNIQQGPEEARDVITLLVNAAKHWSGAHDASLATLKALFDNTYDSGSTVIQLAAERNYVDVVRLILLEDPAFQNGHGSKKSCLIDLIYQAIDKEYSTDIITLLSRKYEEGIDPRYKGVLDLILALKRNDKDCVLDLLRETKELVTFVEEEGWTPLHYAAYHEFVSIFDVIIETQKDVEYQMLHKNGIATPLHVAVEHGYTTTLMELMPLWPASSYSAYTVVNKNGQNILHLAAAANRKEMVQGILKHCPDKYKDKMLKHQDGGGNTPLHLLISHGCYIPQLMKHKGLDTMAKNNKKCTPRDMLYTNDDIVADQVQIKIALDDVRTNQPVWKFWGKSTEKKTASLESIFPLSIREKKDVIFEKHKKLLMDAKHVQMKNDLERYKMRTNTQIIVTALITTVTFTVGFTMPGGLYQSGGVNEGLVVLSRKKSFNAFMISDALALLFSTSALFFYFLESMNEDPRQVAKLNAASTVLNIVSVMAMMLTFIAGTYVVLSHTPALAISVCVIGSLFFLLIIVLLIKMVCDRQEKRDED